MCDTLLCMFGCLTCCGCRNMVTQRVVFFPPPKAYAFESDEVVNSQNDIELSQVNHTMWIMDEAGKRIRTRDVPDFHAYKIPTRNGETIAAFFCKKQKFDCVFTFYFIKVPSLHC